MAGHSKISALTALTSANALGSDELVINDASVPQTKRITLTQLRLWLQENGMTRVQRLDTQHSVSSTTPTKVTDLDTDLDPGTYTFDYRLLVQSATITVGPQFNLNFTGTATRARWWFEYADLSATLLAAIGTMAHDTSTSTLGFLMAKAEDDFATTAAGNMGPVATTNPVQTAATDHMCIIRGIIVVSAVGDLQLWHGSETATATSVEVGSSLVTTFCV